MNTTNPPPVNLPASEDGAYFVHRSWQKFAGRPIDPDNPMRPASSKLEALIVILNEWSDAPDVKRWALEFRWSEREVAEFLEEIPSWDLEG